MKDDKLLEKEINIHLKQLGSRLRDIRERSGYLNYEKFALTNGISQSQYLRYEKGANIQIDTLIKILKALDISLSEFFSEGFD